eukprot:scaffold668_cov385-Prasinococcus_capsulatus_cf.AAC.13
MGLTEAQLEEHFSGIAFLPWERMGNMHGWGGPLSEDIRARRMKLQKRILQRQREFGMVSVLSCFSGHIPTGLVDLYPNMSVTRSPNWGNFPAEDCCNYLLDPDDPMFAHISKLFMEAQTNVYGSDHWYNCDTFNEMDPASTDAAYLQSTSAAVINGIRSVDAQGSWLMQGWLFHSGFWTAANVEAYLSGVSNDSMMILDLNSDVTPIYSAQTYFGKPFVWNMLHNYGGRRGVYGDIPTIALNPVEAKQQYPLEMQGIGITPEAIENNPVVYELMLEMGWHEDAVNVSRWIEDYVWRRYGCAKDDCPLAHEAWDSYLLPCAYTAQTVPALSLMQQHPSLTMADYRGYNTTCVTLGWRLLYEAAKNQRKSGEALAGPFLYDLTDVAYQQFGNLFSDVHALLQSSYQQFQFVGNVDVSTRVYNISKTLKDMIVVADFLLGTNPNYMLGPWTDSARQWGTNKDEKTLLEFTAKNQVTLWGPTGQISDYACKSWGALHKTYYLPRWELFSDMLYNCSLSFTDPDMPCPGRFPDEYEQKLLELEQSWGSSPQGFPQQPEGDNFVALSLVDRFISPWSALDEFQVLEDHDAPGSDLLVSWPSQAAFNTWTNDPAQMAWLCRLDTDCVGFNSNGYLKTSTKNAVETQGCTLYVKKSV